MGLALPVTVARMLGDSVCAQLAEWGEVPKSVSVIDGGSKLILGFEVISIEPKWRRTVEIDALGCRADAVLDQINAWREKMRADIYAGRPSETIRTAIQAFGIDAVAKALEHRAHG